MPRYHDSDPAQSLPPRYVTIQDLLDGKVQAGSLTHVIGIVTDFRVPVPTRGTDWKCQLRLYDISVQHEFESLSVNIFRQEDEMPTVHCGDVMLLTSVKVQRYNMEAVSLLTHYTTAIHIYKAGEIPKPPADAACALRPPSRKKDKLPGERENSYVSYMFHSIDKGRVPDEHEFEVMKIQSKNVKDKFYQLKDVRDGTFCDIIAQVVKEPYDLVDKMNVWVSDYTENPTFYHYAFGGGSLTEGRDGDPFGYTNKYAKEIGPGVEWKGPFGKRSIQLTIWEPHASVIREREITVGTWLSLKNLQIKYGHNGSNLEGFLREDRGAHGPKINISPLDPMGDPESIGQNLKDALRRKRDYERAKKEQLKGIAEAAQAGQKRRATGSLESEPQKMNSKQRRKANRANKQKDNQQVDTPRVDTPQEENSAVVAALNSMVKCENGNKGTSTVAEMLQPMFHPTVVDGENMKLQLPFFNANYRSNIRVVDFMPSSLKDFAVPKKATSEFDVLSDNEDDSDSDSASGSESEPDMMKDFTTVRQWEWRFYLQLEDAAVAPNQKKERVWVSVDNQSAQCLMDLDASNLRHDSKNLEALRQKLFLLWGELEEYKLRAEIKRMKALQAARNNKPPQDSSDEEDSSHKAPKEEKALFNNLPFSCCIRQYGVKVRERDPAKADAGSGKRWQRMYGLFGTRISGG